MDLPFQWIILFISFVLLLAAPIEGYAYSESYFTAGAVMYATSVTVKDQKTNEQGMATTSENELEIGPFIQYSFPASFFGESRFGYRFLLNFNRFSLDHQSIDLTTEYTDSSGIVQTETTSHTMNLGTRSHGRSIYLIPTVFFLMGPNPDQMYALVGFGAGLGGMELQGDLYVTEGSINSSCSTAKEALDPEGIRQSCRKIDYRMNSVGDFVPSYSVIVELKFYRLVLSVTMAILDTSEEDRSYLVTEGLLNLGVTF